MAAIKATQTRLVVGSSTEAWDFSGMSNVLEVALAGEKIENTRFQDTAKTFTTGDVSGSISQNGYFDNTGADSFEQEMSQAMANVETLYVGAIYGTSIAAPSAPVAYIAPATNLEGLKISAPIGGLVTVEGSWFDGQGIKRGFQVYRGTISATGTTSHIDIGAAGTVGGFAWIWVTAVTGTATDAAIVLQSDSDSGFGTAATEATFTFSSDLAQQQALSGTVNRYLRLNTTDMGGATNFTVLVVAAVKGVTY